MTTLHLRKPLSILPPELEIPSRLSDHNRHSEPKTRLNHIKINKNKLPLDFFPKKEYSLRKYIHKNPLPIEYTDSMIPMKSTESERIHYTQ